MQKTVEQIDLAIARWKTRLRRAMTAIDKLERQRKRMLAKPLKVSPAAGAEPVKMSPAQYAEMVKREAAVVQANTPVLQQFGRGIAAQQAADDLAIPGFLQRRKPDAVAQEIEQQQAEVKKRKARGRIDKLKAQQRGDLKRMPLSGKAALDHIRNG